MCVCIYMYICACMYVCALASHLKSVSQTRRWAPAVAPAAQTPVTRGKFIAQTASVKPYVGG